MTYIFGAKATACGLYKALQSDKENSSVDAFVVSKAEGNPTEIWGRPILVLDDVTKNLSAEQREDIKIYVAVPELIHEEIKILLNGKGFMDLVFLDSRTEADIMERYFSRGKAFRSVHDLNVINKDAPLPKATLYAASFYKDKPLLNPPKLSEHIKRLYLGCDRAIENGFDITGKADFYDNTGDNISAKNPNRCEMTAHYWIWKNRLDTDDDYVGVCHYRRMLDIFDDDLLRIKQNDVDAVLLFPMIHYPNAAIHHTWYVPERDWELMLEVLWELQPEYAKRADEIFSKPEFYNYNMFLAKKKVFSDYCAWVYPILDKIEETSVPRGQDREDRYTAYLSESLMTLYFMVNKNNLKIYHTGRLLCT